MSDFDLCIIGGGINGAGIARDAAGRGLKVLVLEQGDWGCCTSSASSKMIHGGLRYLESYEFGMVRKSLAERERLMAIAPQIIRPLILCIPHKHTVRPAWMVRLGLYLYDYLYPRQSLPSSKRIKLRSHDYGASLTNAPQSGFTYADCWVDDARLVLLNIMDARKRGADVRSYSACTALEPQPNGWMISSLDLLNGEKRQDTARMVINATGPYARQFMDATHQSTPATPKLRLVQGAHILVPRLYDGDQAYVLQQPDKRIVFVFPYHGGTLCGTTETLFTGDPMESHASEGEINYLLSALNANFKTPTTRHDVIWSYAGVRPLFDVEGKDNRTISRDYLLFTTRVEPSPLLTVFGGKLTTYRVLAEDVLDQMRRYFKNMPSAWTASQKLPDCPPLPLTARELTDQSLIYFIEKEMARTAEDILWRRTKLGLEFTADESEQLEKRVAHLVKERTGYDTAALSGS